MNEVWMLDYLNAVFPYMGVFESEEAAWEYVETHNSHLPRHHWKPFKITINRDGSSVVSTTAPKRKYICQS